MTGDQQQSRVMNNAYTIMKEIVYLFSIKYFKRLGYKSSVSLNKIKIGVKHFIMNIEFSRNS